MQSAKTMPEISRRSALVLGAAILAPALALPRLAEAATYAPDAGKEILPGIRQVDLGKWAINFGGYKSAVATDYIHAPGAGFPVDTMKNDMICQITEGELWIKQGDNAYTAKVGHVFGCAIGTSEEDMNKSSVTAVMRVIDLLPA
jgi:hypothetical protein